METQQQSETISSSDAAKLRAEIRRRKILQRGDERIKRIFGHSQDEDSSLGVVSQESQNKQLIDQIRKDQDANKEIESSLETQSKEEVHSSSTASKLPEVEASNQNDDVSSEPSPATKPYFDPTLFDKYEKRQSLKKQNLSELSWIQIWILHFIHFWSTKSHLIVLTFLKLTTAAMCSFYNFNIVVPFLFVHFAGLAGNQMLNRTQINTIKLAFQFVRGLFTEFPTFAFVYIAVQAFKISNTTQPNV